jgi:alkaline phosphatase
MFDYVVNEVDYSDGEDIFYGYYLPYQGFSRTDSLSGTTDSAAGGTALSSGIKTINGNVGRDENLNDVKLITELAKKLGKY